MPSNKTVAQKIGLDYTMVSRLRSGNRLPSIETMERIEAAYGWPVIDQLTARKVSAEHYGQEFSEVIANISEDEELDDQDQ